MKSSNFINEAVFNTNLKYVKLQNRTKELFFNCLNDERSYEYFKFELEKIWKNVDHKYYEKDLELYSEIIREQNMQGITEIKATQDNSFIEYLALIPLVNAIKVEDKFVKSKEKEYRISRNSHAYENDKKGYLKRKVQKYNNQIVPYYSKKDGTLIRYVQLSTYEAMIHNTNLTRRGWNTTLNDADNLNIPYFYIPYHSFSCPDCVKYQGRKLSRYEVETFLEVEAEEQEGNILHPNCKCTLVFYQGEERIIRPAFTEGELEEQYDIRQKVNSLTLKKSELLSDRRIQKELGNQDEVDKINQQLRKVNSSIKELQEKLPTEELRKQVVAINR